MTDPTRPTILIVDDRDDLTRFCERVMDEEFRFHHVHCAADARQALAADPRITAVLLDRDFSKADPAGLLGPPEDIRNEGLRILRLLRADHPAIPVLMVTGYREQGPAMEAAELGAEFLAWQDVIADPRILRERIHHTIERSQTPAEEILSRFREQGIVVESPSFGRTLVSLYRSVPGRAPILLLGGTGTGKDTLALAVHNLSGDVTRPYVSVNVASLNPGLIESELFGHARGAYTSADRPALGKLRYADGGTLFLNEVGDLSVEIQAKLLTAIERDEVVPVGDVQSYPARFRLVTATSRDLRDLVESGRFRRDLFHRLAWHTIEIPPLRERREEIPALVRSFLHAAGQGREDGIIGIAREALDYLCELPWEGNVRELRAVVEASAAVARYLITLSDVREVVRRHESFTQPLPPRVQSPGEPSSTEASGDPEVAVFEQTTHRGLMGRYFHYLWRRTNGNLPEIARLAGIAKATAYEWRDRYGPPPGGGRGHDQGGDRVADRALEPPPPSA